MLGTEKGRNGARQKSRPTNNLSPETTNSPITFIPEPRKHVRPGRAFEMRVLGVPEEQPRKDDFKEPRTPTQYEREEREAINNQPKEWDPTSPPTNLSQKLFNVVKGEIEKNHPKLLELFTLKFYSTVDSNLDHNFGVDALFRLEDQFGNSYASATLDLTTSLRKMSGGKANFPVFPSDFLPKNIERLGKMVRACLATCVATRSNGCLGNRRPQYELLIEN